VITVYETQLKHMLISLDSVLAEAKPKSMTAAAASKEQDMYYLGPS